MHTLTLNSYYYSDCGLSTSIGSSDRDLVLPRLTVRVLLYVEGTVAPPLYLITPITKVPSVVSSRLLSLYGGSSRQ